MLYTSIKLNESRESIYKFYSNFLKINFSEFETSYENDSLSFLNNLNVSFAGVYKNKSGNICLFRECFGRIPIYYYLKNNVLYYSSNISDLFKIYDDSLKLNKSEIIKYLKNSLENSYSEETLVQGIYSVLPGHIIEINLENNTKVNRCFFALEKKNEFSTIKDFKNLFFNSVNKYLNLKIPFGAQLSGGLDSSSVVSTIVNISKKSFKTIEYRSGDELIDETDYSKTVVQEFKLDHCLKNSMDNRIIHEFLQLMNYSGLPDLAITPVGRELLYKEWMTLNKLGLIFTGSGGDDILGYRFIYLDNLFNLEKYENYFLGLKSIKLRFEVENYPTSQLVFDIYTKFINSPWKVKIVLIAKIIKFGFLPNFLSEGLKSIFRKFSLKKSNLLDKIYYEIEQFYDDNYLNGIKNNNNKYLDYVLDFFNPIFFKVMEQNYSMEKNCNIIIAKPFLDKKLMDFMANAQDEFNFNKGIGRNYLRAAMEGIVPVKILKRVSKTDFGNINKHAFNIFWKEHKQILNKLHPIAQFVNIEEVFKLVHNHEKKRLSGYDYLKLNRIIYLSLWMDYLKANYNFN